MTSSDTVWQAASDLASDPQHRNPSQDLEQPLLPPETPRTPSHNAEHLQNSQSFDTQRRRTCWQWLAFGWISPLLNFGSTLPQLQQRHLPPVPLSSTPDHCGDALWDAWNKELLRAATHRRSPSLFRALFRTFGGPYLAIGVLKLVNDALNFTGPVLLSGLLRYLDAAGTAEPDDYQFLAADGATEFGKHSTKPHPEPNVPIISDITVNYGSHIFGATCAALLALSMFLKALLNAHYAYLLGLISSRVRAALTSLCFRRTLSLPASQLAAVGSGKVQTLMAVDTDKVLGYFAGFHELWSLPLQICIALWLLYTQVQFAFLAGLGLVIFIIPINKALANGIQHASMMMMDAKDRRIAVISELLRGIKAVKAAGWEAVFTAKINATREEELKHLATRKYLDAFCVYLWAATSLLFSLGTFGLFVLLGKELTAQVAFTSLALFSVLLGPINSFPWVINGIVEAGVSNRRLSSFLATSATPPPAPTPTISLNELRVGSPRESTNGSPLDTPRTASLPLQVPAVKVCWGNYTWSSDTSSEVPTLHDIELEIPAGCFVAITGDVGSGKSSLLSAILGEMRALPGTVVRVQGSTAYAAQEPWLMPGTIRDNILIGGEVRGGRSGTPRSAPSVDPERYYQVLRACALIEDLRRMPGGDGTWVGDAGSTLSGGQRARVALARALYRRADVYLLDDVISSVDARVGAWIVEHALCGQLLEGKTVLVTTHSQALLDAADIVVRMQGGRIASVTQIPLSSPRNPGIRRRRRSFMGSEYSTPRAGAAAAAAAAGLWRRGLEAVRNSPSPPDYLDSGGNVSAREPYVTPGSTPKGKSSINPSENDASFYEMRAVGHVKGSVYWLYCKMQGIWAPITLFSLALMQATRNGSDLWLSFWVNHTGQSPDPPATIFNSTTSVSTAPMGTAGTTFGTGGHVLSLRAPFVLVGSLVPWELDPEVEYYLGILLAIAAANTIFTLIRAFAFAQGGLVAARRLHTRLLSSVLALPPSFFDSNPTGRILNRFSSDTAIADDSLPFIANIFLAQAFGLAGVIAVLCFTQPYIILALFPLVLVYRVLQRYYTCTSRELRRLDSIAKSPVYSAFSSALTGVATIRAFAAEERFLAAAHDAIESQQRASLAALAASTWLGIRLQAIAGGITGLVGGLAVAQHAGLIPGAAQGSSAGFVGLSLAYALPICGLLNGLLTSGAETEQEMVAVERIGQYIDTEPQPEVLHIAPSLDTQRSPGTGGELGAGAGPTGLAMLLEDGNGMATPGVASPMAGGASLVSPLLAVTWQGIDQHSEKNFTPRKYAPSIPVDWPSRGAIAFNNVWLRYGTHSPFVLQSLNLEVPAGTRAGICGRTGAGKSSAVASLLRLAEIVAGSVTIDGVDVRSIPLRRLRRSIGYVPQTPFVFSGTVGENLDPLHQYTLSQMVAALQQVGLWPALVAAARAQGVGAEETEDGAVLRLWLGEGGVGLSQGQQQMLCLARVVLQRPKIVCLDEASAAVDPDTAAAMQRVVGESFSGCTVLEVSHRLISVSECDVVFVLEGGKVLEAGPPRTLAVVQGSLFAGMVKEQLGHLSDTGCTII